VTDNVRGGADHENSIRLSPVIVFAYGRVKHLRRCIESLLANPEASATALTFFCDAARNPGDRSRVDEVRAYVDEVRGFQSIRRIYRERNLGLARSVMDGVTETLATHGRVIVLEDDLVLSPHFLRYMNDGLNRYEHDDRVASIHAYTYPVDVELPETFFLRGADCWGWATWSRAWSHFEEDGTRLLTQLRDSGLSREFDLDWQFPYVGMLRDQIAGRNNSWAILWHASCFLKNRLTLYPGRSLVQNIGNDSSGTHCGTTDGFSREPTEQPVRVDDIVVEPSNLARRAFMAFLRTRISLGTRIRNSVKRALTIYA